MGGEVRIQEEGCASIEGCGLGMGGEPLIVTLTELRSDTQDTSILGLNDVTDLFDFRVLALFCRSE